MLSRHLRRPPFWFSKQRQCRWCGGVVPPERRRWCAQTCINEYLVRSSASFARAKVRKRDQGVCAECKTDTTELKTLFRERQRLGEDHFLTKIAESPFRAWSERDLMLVWHGRVAAWDVDHIVPVEKNGGQCSLDGLQTLCRPCHLRKTAEQARKRKLPAVRRLRLRATS